MRAIHLIQERVLHFGVIGMARLYLFNPFADCVHGARAMQADHELVSATLSELDIVLGDAQPRQRTWVAGAPNAYNTYIHHRPMTV